MRKYLFVILFLVTSLNACDSHRQLLEAISNNNHDQAALLLEQGSDVNACDEKGTTPFLFAVAKANMRLVSLCIAHGADLNIHNKYGCFALAIAAMNNNLPLVRLLLESGADIEKKDPHGWTALMSAVNCNQNSTTVHYLLHRKANPNVCDNLGITPLMLALRHRVNGNIQLLLQAGASLHAVDCKGKSIARWAEDYRNSTIVNLLNSKPYKILPPELIVIARYAIFLAFLIHFLYFL